MDALTVFQQTAEGVIAGVSVLGNVLVLYVIYRQTNLHTTTNYLIASLASADFLVGFVGIPFVIVNNMGLPIGNFYACLFMNCTIVCFTQVSIFSLMLIALERCAAVLAPIKHRQYFHGKVVSICLVFVWLTAILVGLVPMFGWHPPAPPANSVEMSQLVCSFTSVIDMNYMVYFSFMTCVLAPLIIMYSTYGYIYHFVSKAKRPAGPVVKHVDVQPTVSRATAGGHDEKDSKEKSEKKMNKESSATKRIFLVLVFFTICWMPIQLMNTFSLFTNWFNNAAVIIAVLLSHLNSALNPLLYAATNPKILAAFRATLCPKSKTSRVGDVGHSGEMITKHEKE